jgi:hypothetical protein
MPGSNNKPRDHHYVPVFYLKQWCGPNNKLIEFAVKVVHHDALGSSS